MEASRYQAELGSLVKPCANVFYALDNTGPYHSKLTPADGIAKLMRPPVNISKEGIGLH